VCEIRRKVRPERHGEEEVESDELVEGMHRSLALLVGRMVGEEVDKGDVGVEEEGDDDCEGPRGIKLQSPFRQLGGR
jgi:hypothetical protein